MHYFIMNMNNLTQTQVKLSLRIGTKLKNIYIAPCSRARSRAYDFLEVTECLHWPLSLLWSGDLTNSVAMTDFGNPMLFKMNYASNILFHMQVPEVDFLNSHQKSLIYDIKKLDHYVSIHPATRDQELQTLRDELRLEMHQYL